MSLGSSETAHFTRYERGRPQHAESQIVRESLVRLHVNGQELATLMCTPHDLDLLALGFLRSENIIQGMQDVRLVKACPSQTCVEVWLNRADFTPPKRVIITSGCGGGITFVDLTAKSAPLSSEIQVLPDQIGRLMRSLQSRQAIRGMHTTALAEGEDLLVVIEDVGRHNTIDKIWGYCLREAIDPRDRILVTTGRISSEMLSKAARMQVPIVVSRTSPTSLSLSLAEAWNLTLIGYTRSNSFNVYTGLTRVRENEEVKADANAR